MNPRKARMSNVVWTLLKCANLKKNIAGAESTIGGAEISIAGAEGYPKGIQIDTHG